MAALLHHSSHLEVLSIERLRYYPDVEAQPNFHAANSLKFIKLSYFYYDVRSLEMIPNNSFLVEVHLDNVNVTDVGVSSLSKWVKEALCWELEQIGDEGLIAVGKHSVNLEKLILNGVGASCVSLQVIATNCRKLIRLEVHRCETITEAEMICIAEKCVALRILCIDDEVYVYEASTEPEPVSTSSSSTGNGGRTLVHQ
nr:hypothetical protein [Tanacetum cinerariifolium]